MNVRPARLLPAALFAFSLAAPAIAQQTQAFEIRFDARMGDKPVRCGESYANIGSTKATATLQDFRLYVSEVRLITADGRDVPLQLTPDNQWQNDRLALLDFENATGNCNGNAATNTVIRGTAPAGSYKGLAFEIGVPFDLNHKDPTLASAPLNYSALTWPWRTGYKFVSIDLETTPRDGAANASGFSLHLGSTECGAGSPTRPPTAPCANPNRSAYRLTTFNPKSQKVILDLAALLANTDVTTNAAGSTSGCMAAATDDDCTAIMDNLGLTFRGKTPTGQIFVKAG
jgi:uncharacterized repeat protein (TIGR04052 family)